MKDIIKEVEQLLDNMRAPGFILTRKLVNEAKRLKVESENSEKIEHFATKTIERQSAEIEKKDIEIDILIRKKEALKDEVEQWKEEANKYQNLWCEAVKDIQTAKSEAIKEFAKEFVADLSPMLTYDKDYVKAKIFKLVETKEKEMVGDDNA